MEMKEHFPWIYLINDDRTSILCPGWVQGLQGLHGSTGEIALRAHLVSICRV